MTSDASFMTLKTLRVDQVGSLKSPSELDAVFAQYKKGQASEADLDRARDLGIIKIIRQQDEHRFPIITDGELRRRNFQESFGSSVSGFDVARDDHSMDKVSTVPLTRAEQDFAAAGPAILTRRKVVDRLRLVRNIPLEEYQFASKQTNTPVKVTMLSPDRISQRFDWERSRDIYPDQDAFLADVIDISRTMISQLSDAGCRYIQIDAPGYTAYADQISLERMRSRGENPAENMRRSIAADNKIIRGFDHIVFGIHLCRGNARTIDPTTGKIAPQWHREGHYDAIAEELFSSLKHQRLLLEYDDERSGSFEALRFVRKDAVAVLGLVTTKREEVESADLLTRRIDDASRFLPVEQLAISPQCGFGGLDHLSVSDSSQWGKLDRMMEVADKVWRH